VPNGVPTYLIKRQTGHKSSKMLDRYIRLGEMFTRNAASGLDSECVSQLKSSSENSPFSDQLLHCASLPFFFPA